MKIIITTIKVILLTFLILFFISGLGFHFDTEPEKKNAVKVMLFISGSILCYLSYRWILLPRRKNKLGISHSPVSDSVSSVTDRIYTEFEKENKKLDTEESTNNSSTEYHPTSGTDSKELQKSPYTMVNDEATIWTGNINNISFSFLNDNEKKQRITGELNRVFLNKKGDFYISIIDNNGINHLINEQYVETKFLVKSSRYRFVELCREILKLNNSDVFEYANIIRDIASTAKLIKEIPPIRTSFTYTFFKNELRVREKHDIFIDQYLENEHGHQWISGLDSNTKKRHIFQKSKIDTMLNSEGHKKHKFDEWLIVIFGIENNGNK